MRESTFITEVKRSIFHYGGWAYKISDMPQSMISGARFNPEKPADLVCSINGKFVGIECKLFKKYQAFGLRHLRETQVRGLDGIMKDGQGFSYVFLNIRQPADKGSGIKRLNRLIIFDWDILSEKWNMFGTIKKKELESYPYIEGNKKMFNISDWVLGF